MAAKQLNVAAIQKLFALLKQRHDEDGALLEELERLIGGGPGIGELMKGRYAAWNEAWSLTHSGTYVFNFTVDAPQMKRLIRELGVEELDARMVNYMRDRDEWLMRNKHPFGAFVKQNNRYATSQQEWPPAAVVPPTGCKHQPPCRSDQAHTKRLNAEVRA
jgi:hypothetical protein